MGRGVELLTGFVTAPSTTQTALTMASGNSLTIRNHDQGRAWLLQAWNDNQTAGVLRIFSPRMHDGVQGLRLQAGTANPRPLLPNIPTPLESQDTISVDLSGSATAGDIETACLLVMYEDLPGVNGRFIDVPTLRNRARQLMAVQNTTLSLGTAGGYSGEVAINASFDNLKANRDYALLGYHVSAECAAIRWRGSDLGNLGVGGPGNLANKDITSQWFVWLSEKFQTALIPVFNASNKGSFLIDGAQDENGTDVTVSSIFMELD